jgi:hypothetical protein
MSTYLGKRRNNLQRLSRSMLRMSLLFEIMEKEKEIHASLAVTLQNGKVIATVHKCLVKIEKPLQMWNI